MEKSAAERRGRDRRKIGEESEKKWAENGRKAGKKHII